MDALIQVQDSAHIHAAANSLVALLASNGRPITTRLHTPIGLFEIEVYWVEELGIWGCCQWDPNENKYWCPFGVIDPTGLESIPYTCEINLGIMPGAERMHGMLLNEKGLTYLAHSGQFSKHKRSDFRGFTNSSNWYLYERMRSRGEALVIGAIDSASLLGSLKEFVDVVELFKRATPAESFGPAEPPELPTDFIPEFDKSYVRTRVESEIEVRRVHGLVLNSLEKELSELGIACTNDQGGDLFFEHGGLKAVVEVKTNLASQSLYTAIGQLHVHRIRTQSQRMIYVTPTGLSKQAVRILEELQIVVLEFDFNKGYPVFAGLRSLLSSWN